MPVYVVRWLVIIWPFLVFFGYIPYVRMTNLIWWIYGEERSAYACVAFRLFCFDIICCTDCVGPQDGCTLLVPVINWGPHVTFDDRIAAFDHDWARAFHSVDTPGQCRRAWEMLPFAWFSVASVLDYMSQEACLSERKMYCHTTYGRDDLYRGFSSASTFVIKAAVDATYFSMLH